MRRARSKLVGLAEAVEAARQVQRGGGRVVFTNGCFDILHAGHVLCLEQARALGELLIVGLNSDRSVRAQNKAPGRPIVPQQQRAVVLGGLEAVDLVVIFDEPTPLDLIRRIRPDVLVKGGDWAEEEIVGADVVRAGGGEVVRVELVEGVSTTAIVERILAGAGRKDG